MTLNKMVWHKFLAQFSMLFQMVPFILLCLVANSTITWWVETIPTANQRALCWWFLKLPWREKRKVPSERAMKIESETGVKSDTPFCSQQPIEKTNSDYCNRNGASLRSASIPLPSRGCGSLILFLPIHYKHNKHGNSLYLTQDTPLHLVKAQSRISNQMM